MTEIGQHIDQLDTPILWTDLERLERNIRMIAAHFSAAGINWRPHTKGMKIPAIAYKALAAGAIGVTCAKLGEAEVMAAAGIRDILIANQIVGPHKITRLVHLQHQADVKAAVDNAAVVAQIGAAAAERGAEVGLLVEVNTGMNRAGAEPGQATVELAGLVHDTPGVRLAGLMTWEGHTLSAPTPDEKRAAIEKSMELYRSTVEACRAADLPIEIVSGGGSGTATITPGLGVITEIQAGGAVFGDVSYRNWWEALEPALYVRTVVTSRPTPERVIIDAGYKSLPTSNRTPECATLGAVVSHRGSAEHGVITLEAPDTTTQVGDLLDFLVGYGDATVFLHDNLYGIRDGVVEAVWPILGRGKLR
ncbi:MAG: alanine racemase [Caldilineaceae bacterium]